MLLTTRRQTLEKLLRSLPLSLLTEGSKLSLRSQGARGTHPGSPSASDHRAQSLGSMGQMQVAALPFPTTYR